MLGNSTHPTKLLENKILGKNLTYDFIIFPTKFVRKGKLHQKARLNRFFKRLADKKHVKRISIFIENYLNFICGAENS